MTDEFKELTIDEKKELVKTIVSNEASYDEKLDAYEILCEDGEEVIDDMLTEIINADDESGQMLAEILANYKGRKDIFMWLVTYFYRGEDVALFAKLLGSYGDEAAIGILQSFAKEYDLNYNEFVEIRNAVEELGGEFDLEKDFTEDPLYRYLKGLDEPSVFEQNKCSSDDNEDDSDGNSDDDNSDV